MRNIYTLLATALLLLFIVPFIQCSKTEEDKCGDKVIDEWNSISFSLDYVDPTYEIAIFTFDATSSNMCIYEMAWIDFQIWIYKEFDDNIRDVSAKATIGGSWTPTIRVETSADDYEIDYFCYQDLNPHQGYNTGPASMTITIKINVIADTEALAWERLNQAFRKGRISISYNQHKD